jgi:hypothetical protein
VVLLLALGLTRCATAPRPAPTTAVPIAPGQAVELARRWAAEWESFPGLRAATDLTVKNRQRTDRASALLLVSPIALRVEIATPFGLPALVATAGPDDITIFQVAERRAQTARPSPAAIERWLGVPLAPAALIRLLVGHVAPPADPGAIAIESAPSPHLAWTEGDVRHRVWVTADGRPARLLLEPAGGSGEALAADFQWLTSGSLAAVRLEAPDRGAEVIVRYLSAEYVQPSPDAFRLALPPGVPVESLD